jgi:ribosomal protein S18 acetylase RimI-like enzyme
LAVDQEPGILMAIRNARIADTAAMSKLAIASFTDAYADTSEPGDLQKHLDTYFSEPAISAELKQEGIRYLVSTQPEGLAGLAKLRDSELPEPVSAATAIEVQQLYVDPALQRRGIGQELMTGAVAVAREQGVAGLWLSVWTEADWATSFYRKFGFDEVGVADFWLGKSHYVDYVMWLPLNDPAGDGTQ